MNKDHENCPFYKQERELRSSERGSSPLCFGDFKTKCRALSEYICKGDPYSYEKCPFYKPVKEANNERMKYFDKEVAYRKKLKV